MAPTACPADGALSLCGHHRAGDTKINTNHLNGVSIGDAILISSVGGEEINEISGFGSIILKTPLQFNHPHGTFIVKTTKAPTTVPTPSPTNAPTYDSCDEEPVWEFGDTGSLEGGCAGSNHSDSCFATCAAGYGAVGRLEYECVQGKWVLLSESTPPCKPLSCSNPLPVPKALNSPNAACAGLPHGGVCQTTCPDGYELKGEVTCQFGEFKIPYFGCVVVEADNTERFARVLVFELRLNLGGASNSGGSNTADRDFAWANREVFVAALQMVGVEFEQIFIVGASSFNDALAPGGQRLLSGSDVPPQRQRAASPSDLLPNMHDRPTARLLQSASSGIKLDTVIHVRAEDNLTQIQGTLASAGDGTSGFASTLMSNVLLEFETQGVEVPMALKTATVSTKDVNVLQNVEMPKSQWIVSAWTKCSNGCGTGTRTRTIECSTGNPWACSQDSSTRDIPLPATSETCEDFDACPYEYFCPLGRDSDAACSAQAVVVIFAHIIPVTIFILCILRAIQIQRRRRTEETNQVAQNPGYPPPIDNSKEDSPAPEAPPAVAPPAAAALAAVAAVAAAAAQAEASPAPEAAAAPTAAAPKAAGKAAAGARAAGKAAAGKAAAGKAAAKAAAKPKPKPQAKTAAPPPPVTDHRMYELHQRVEYYSTTDQMWLAGRISNSRVITVPKPTLMYDVTLTGRIDEVTSSEEVRECVPLELVRPVFVEGEPCSFFRTSEDRWLPAVIYGTQSEDCTSTGYKITLVDEQKNVKVPASCLRRRFPASSVVEAYEDEARGWVKATVIQEQVQESVDSLSAAWDAIVAQRSLLVSNPGDPENPALETGDGPAISPYTVVSGLAKAPEHTTSQGQASTTTPRGKGASPRRRSGAQICRWSLVELSVGETRKTLPSFRLRPPATPLEVAPTEIMAVELTYDVWDEDHEVPNSTIPRSGESEVAPTEIMAVELTYDVWDEDHEVPNSTIPRSGESEPFRPRTGLSPRSEAAENNLTETQWI
eukprot:TRINITY_DN1608_c0_g1_i5.p1 TRINITY_DN1608_c0_g1~~TRINITY_DN1608_c0_g1_i5.p1  ORF type:complete len:1024 (-),score=143.44 TRINITY_DN1608_c0_g1_i5:103-3096(-)